MSDYTPEPEWTFTSTITAPNGHRVDVTISVPQRLVDHGNAEILEQGDLAQAAAFRAFRLLGESTGPGIRDLGVKAPF